MSGGVQAPEPDPQGFSALRAVATGDVQALIQAAADQEAPAAAPPPPPPPCLLTPLHVAAALGRSSCLTLLIARGARREGLAQSDAAMPPSIPIGTPPPPPPPPLPLASCDSGAGADPMALTAPPPHGLPAEPDDLGDDTDYAHYEVRGCIALRVRALGSWLGRLDGWRLLRRPPRTAACLPDSNTPPRPLAWPVDRVQEPRLPADPAPGAAERVPVSDDGGSRGVDRLAAGPGCTRRASSAQRLAM